VADPISLAGAAIGAGGALFKGFASSSMYGYQAQIAQMNAQIARQNSAYESALGETQAQQSGMKTRAIIAETKAGQGASGLDLTSGTSVEVRASEAELGAEDQSMIRSNAARRAYGYEVQASQDVAQANLDKAASSNSIISGLFDAGSSILGGGGGIASRWLKGQMAGLPANDPILTGGLY
jgi:hypothetical protein